MCERRELLCLPVRWGKQTRRSEPRRPLIPASSTRAAAADGGQGPEAPQDKVWPQQKRGWLVGQSPMYLLPFFLGMGFLPRTMTLSLSEPEVQSSRPRSLGQREMQ